MPGRIEVYFEWAVFCEPKLYIGCRLRAKLIFWGVLAVRC